MEESLLRSHGIGSNYPRRDLTRPFNRRSDAIAYGTPYQKAAALVDLAEDGVGLPEEILYESNFQKAAKFYFLYTRLDFIWTLNLFALIVLNFLEINLDEFADLCNAISLRFQKEETPPWLENYPQFYHSPLSTMLKDFVRSPRFGYIITFVLLLNSVAVVIETTLDIENNSSQKVWQGVEFTFGWIYVVEMALKVYAMGFENYWMDGQNRFDFVVTCVIAVGETTTFVSPHGLTFLSNGEWIRYLLIARMLRLIRILMDIKQYRAFVATFLTLIPSLMPYLGTIFCVLCMYCSLGVQVFGGLVNAGNPQLEGSTLADDDYTLFNFNDYPNGMVTLFNLLVMGNWQDWMQGYKELTGSTWSIAYFISFYLITVLLLLNLVIAFVLEAFFAEMEIEDSTKCEEVKEAEENHHRRQFAGSKTRSQRVDALLHHMLSAELDQTNCSSS
uniref:Ion transport domain-containing protein n=2 Tax=Kalanchoe fedtschenkoi TaxID=63787 RepID=A0A7N0U384_KALFE